MKIKKVDTIVTVKHRGRTYRRTFSRNLLSTELLWEKSKLLSIGENWHNVDKKEYPELERTYQTAMALHINTKS